MKKCEGPGCDVEFEPKRKGQKYCCERCSYNAANLRYRRKHSKEERKQYMRDYRAARKEAPAPKESKVIKLQTVYVPKEGPKRQHESYGHRAAKSLLEQQAREMELRRAKFYAELKEDKK